MRTDLRVKHDIGVRGRAAALFSSGRGYKSVAGELAVPRGTVRK